MTEDGLDYLIEIFLPTADNRGVPFGRECFDAVRDELLERFGGVTLFSRSPAEGLWAADETGEPSRDRMITVEVMTDTLERGWWAAYRQRLEQRFAQDAILIRSFEIRTL